jgi:hypothetical protein
MANNCFNYIQVFGSEKGMRMFYDNLLKNRYEDEFVVVGLGDFSKDPTSLEFSAESRWSPPKDKLQSLSKDYSLVIECEYDEWGSDIAGKFGFDKGELVFNLEFTYLEGKYHFEEWSDFLESEAIPRLDDCESFNEFMDMFYFVNADEHAELVEIYREHVTK